MVFHLIAGDSHSGRLKFNQSQNLLCSAGSAKGLNNPHSISQYNKKIIKFLNENNNNIHKVFLLFGAVDTDFGYIHKLLNNQVTSFETFNTEVIDNYLSFITQNLYHKHVIVLSIGLPTLDDSHLKVGLLNGHINHLESYQVDKLRNQLNSFNYLPNIKQRTQININFNHQLKQRIASLNNPFITFLDVTSFTYDANLGRIQDQFFTRRDHHNFTRTQPICDIINNFLKNDRTGQPALLPPSPHPTVDYNFYRSFYEDLKPFPNSFLDFHYETYGKKEMRFPTFSAYETFLRENNLDLDFYGNYHPDLKHMNKVELINHFINFGKNENRLSAAPK